MATLPAFLTKTEDSTAALPGRRPAPVRAERDPYQLRALPHEDVFFYSKKIDNSRLVREADPRSRSACWSAIGGAGLVLVLLTGVLAPSVANTLEGYKLESLRAEQRRLLNERQVLQLQEAEMLRPDRLEKLAKRQDLVTPTTEQVVHLDGKGDGTVAMVK
jgi:cell division protein FtsL